MFVIFMKCVTLIAFLQLFLVLFGEVSCFDRLCWIVLFDVGRLQEQAVLH